MKQLFQDLKAGRIQVVDLPEPSLQPGFLLVRNAFSVISPGTERLVVSAGRDSYLKTARARPDLVRRVIQSVKQDGLKATYERVKSKLGEPLALGYSSAGIVKAVGPGVGDLFRPGAAVACAGGGFASHAEVVAVPVNLAAPVPDGVELEHAAFATLGAIALHGVRQGTPTLGERFGVIGCCGRAAFVWPPSTSPRTWSSAPGLWVRRPGSPGVRTTRSRPPWPGPAASGSTACW